MFVGVLVGVFVGVGVLVAVGVFDGVDVKTTPSRYLICESRVASVQVGVLVGVPVAVGVRVGVAVFATVPVGVGVAVLVGVRVGVTEGVGVCTALVFRTMKMLNSGPTEAGAERPTGATLACGPSGSVTGPPA